MVATAEGFYRRKTQDNLDFYPTPPWATRALFRYILGDYTYLNYSAFEPACGNGHISEVLKTQFRQVQSLDIECRDYFDARVGDYFQTTVEPPYNDWIITNPPFSLANRFILKAINEAQIGVAMFCRLSLLEGANRYKTIFVETPPTIVAPFVERVTLIKNKVTKKRCSTTAYAWFVWYIHNMESTKIVWIPPCKKELEKDSDYA
jgi:hypothetical protein